MHCKYLRALKGHFYNQKSYLLESKGTSDQNLSYYTVEKIPLGIWTWAGTIETFITSVIKTVSDTIEENNLDSTEDVTRFYRMEPIQMRSISTKVAPMNLYSHCC